MLYLGFEHGELVPGVRVGHLAGRGPGSWLGAAPRCSCDSWLAAAEVGHGAGLQQLAGWAAKRQVRSRVLRLHHRAGRVV